MIPTAHNNCVRYKKSVRFWLALPVLALFASSCTNSKLIISPLYNQLDNRMRSSFNKLGDFSNSQKAYFDQRVGTFHVWHRQSELPRYAELLDNIRATIATPGNANPDEVMSWLETAESFTRAVRECHPVNYSFDLMKSLTDDQIDSIDRHFENERQKHLKERAKRTHEERIAYRADNITRWASRVGLDFNDEQRKLLRETLTRQISLRNQYNHLSDIWRLQLFAYAHDQKAPDYDAKMAAHLGELWTLLEKAHPDEWQSNRELWRGFAVRFMESLTNDQRRSSAKWIGKMSRTLKSISRDTPSFGVGTDSRMGCLVDKTSSSSS
jgi:hypothetical protein